MSKEKKMSVEEAIAELRQEAEEIENAPDAFKNYAHNAYRARIRRNVADKLEKELNQKNTDSVEE